MFTRWSLISIEKKLSLPLHPLSSLKAQRLDVLVNNAAIVDGADGPPSTVSSSVVQRVMETNFFGTLAVTLPGGRLFLDSAEQAIAVALVDGYTVRHRSVQTHRGGLGSARLRRIKEFVDARNFWATKRRTGAAEQVPCGSPAIEGKSVVSCGSVCDTRFGDRSHWRSSGPTRV